jgi:uncharacterized membrane protein
MNLVNDNDKKEKELSWDEIKYEFISVIALQILLAMVMLLDYTFDFLPTLVHITFDVIILIGLFTCLISIILKYKRSKQENN